MSITPLSTSSVSAGSGSGQTATATATSTAASTASTTSLTTLALNKANARIQAQMGATGAQLSSMGKLKSTVAELQTGARALSALTATASAADVKSGLNRLVSAFNSSLAAAKTASTALASGDPSGAKRVGNELSRSMSANASTLDALRKMGVKQQADGTLTLDTAKLDKAWSSDPNGVQAALAKIGATADQLATKELATKGHVSLSMASLNKKSSELNTQHKAILAMGQDSSTATTTASGVSTTGSSLSAGYMSYALSAYKA